MTVNLGRTVILYGLLMAISISPETEAVCLRSSLPINDGIITLCSDVNGNNVSSTQGIQSLGVVCMVTNPTCRDRSTLVQCTENGWFSENNISDAECKGEPLTLETKTQTKILRRKPRWLGIIIRSFFSALGCLWSTCSERRTAGDTSLPALICPTDIKQYADPLQTSQSAFWAEPESYDNIDGKISPSREGPGPGSMFPEGTTTISYYAKDKNGNWAKCSFLITIHVTRCPAIVGISDGFFACQPLTDYLSGTYCSFGCYKGHYLNGPKTTECLRNERWSSETPTCEKKTCSALIPSSEVVQISCSDQNKYRSKCTYTCKNGYDIAPGKTRVRVCTEYQYWHGEEPVCEDTEPPMIHNCPDTVAGYTQIYKMEGQVAWSEPYVSDNSGDALLEQISGPRSFETIPAGVHRVIYLALDKKNNSRICSFKVIMKQIACFPLQPKPYSWVSCPNGTIEGSTCVFSCIEGKTLQGHDSFTCRKEGEEHKYGVWSLKEYPYCVSSAKCPSLNAPDNGAVVCDTWLKGSVCQMQCEKGYDLPNDVNSYEYNRLLICGDSGIWNMNPAFSLPNCAKVISGQRSSRFKMKVGFYYGGACEQYMNEIKSNFIRMFINDETFSSLCTSNLKCSFDNVKVQCGKRNDQKRSVALMVVDVDTQLEDNVGLSNLRDLLIALESKRKDLLHRIEELIEKGNISLTINNTVISPAYVSGSDIVPNCEPGSEPATGSVQCIECNPGYYHNNETNKCTQCPKGEYQNKSGQIYCIQCMPNQTTMYTGSTVCVDACPPGTWSITGTVQDICSPCPLGTFSEDYGLIICKRCPASQTTVSEGCSTIESCKEFDMEFPVSDTNSTASLMYNLPGSVSDVYIGIWVRCQDCGNPSLMEIISMDDEELLFKVKVADFLGVNIKGYIHESPIRSFLLDGRWHHLLFNISTKSLSLCLDITVCFNFTHVLTEKWLPENIKLQFGGDFSGSISQVNIWSPEKYPEADVMCFNTDEADLLPWQEFAKATLYGTILQIPSECDMDGKWSEWASWSDCSVSCSNGTQVRYRSCTNPSPDNGGVKCQGGDTESAACGKPACKVKSAADTNQIQQSYTYVNLSCYDHDFELKAKRAVTEITTRYVSNTDCVVDGNCTIKSLDISNCDASEGERIEIRTLQVTVVLSCVPSLVGVQFCVDGLLGSAEYIQTLMESRLLDVVVYNTTYLVDVNSTSLSGGSTCKAGETAVEYYCLPCGTGTFEKDGSCILCSKGTYQDDSKQTSCKQCPDGRTTKGLGSVNSTLCDVELSRDHSGIIYFLILGLILGCLTIMAIIAIPLVLRRKHKD